MLHKRIADRASKQPEREEKLVSLRHYSRPFGSISARQVTLIELTDGGLSKSYVHKDGRGIGFDSDGSVHMVGHSRKVAAEAGPVEFESLFAKLIHNEEMYETLIAAYEELEDEYNMPGRLDYEKAMTKVDIPLDPAENLMSRMQSQGQRAVAIEYLRARADIPIVWAALRAERKRGAEREGKFGILIDQAVEKERERNEKDVRAITREQADENEVANARALDMKAELLIMKTKLTQLRERSSTLTNKVARDIWTRLVPAGASFSSKLRKLAVGIMEDVLGFECNSDGPVEREDAPDYDQDRTPHTGPIPDLIRDPPADQ